MPDLLYLRPSQLRLHPENMRRIYPASHVGEMADSIQAHGGVVQALQIVPDPERSECYLVVDGNLRLAGAQSLGETAPDLKCELVDADHAEQLLIMAITSHFVFKKDPISEALHYLRLLEEGYSQVDIGRYTGLSSSLIASRLHLLDLDPEIQRLVAEGTFSKDKRAVDAILAIPDRDARIRLANSLASRRATLETIVRACQKLLEQMAARKNLVASPTPAIAHSKTNLLPPARKASWHGVRGAVKAACNACNIHEEALANVAEPAWELITHAADETCAGCNLRQLQSLCGECPAVELLRRLAQASEGAGIPVVLPALKAASNGRH